jgi:hypothetical protein
MIKRIFLSTTLISLLFSCGPGAPSEIVQQRSETDSTYYLEKGQEITQAAFDTLSKTLQNAIAERGAASAIVFCNIQALPITTSAATDDVFEIKRTSLKIRNPQNAATDFERNILNDFAQAFSKEEELKSRVISRGDTVHFFRPIKLMPMCTMCHGNKKNIPAEVSEKLSQLYPNDLATGYSPGDLRGMWHVKFVKYLYEKGE